MDTLIGWPPHPRPQLLGAVRAGFSFIAARHPDVLAAVRVDPTQLAQAPAAIDAKPSVAHGCMENLPVLAMVATLGITAARHSPEVVTAAALLTMSWALSTRSSAPECAPSLVAACRSVREWSTGSAMPQSLADAIGPHRVDKKNLKRLCGAVTELLTTDAVLRTNTRFADYERALSFLSGARSPRPRQPGAGTDERSSPDGHDAAADTATVLAETTPPDERTPRLRARTQGDPNALFSTSRSFYSSELAREIRTAFAAGLDPRTREEQKKRAVRSAGHVVRFGSPDQLHPLDIQLLREIGPAQGPTAHAIYLTALYAGRSPEELTRLQVVGSYREVEAMARTGIHPSTSGSSHLLLEPFGILAPNRVNPRLPAGRDDDSPAPSTFLPWPDRSDHALAGVRRIAERRVGCPLFDAGEVADAGRALAQAARPIGSALRLARLGGMLRHELLALTGADWAWQYLGARDPDVRHVPALHYQRYELGEIATVGRKAVARIDRLFGDMSGVPEGSIRLPATGNVGSRRVPDETALAAKIAALASGCVAKPIGRPYPSTWSPYHNAYTDYCVAVLLAASAIRPFSAGFAALAPLDDRWVANEKPQGGSGGRVIPASGLVRQQAVLYATHRSAVIKALGLKDAPWFFRLDRDRTVTPYTPEIWKGVIAPFDDNTFRHWLPNALRAMGWRGDRLAHFFGHVGTSDRPTDAFTTIPANWSPIEMEEIEMLIRRLGVHPVEGLGRG